MRIDQRLEHRTARLQAVECAYDCLVVWDLLIKNKTVDESVLRRSEKCNSLEAVAKLASLDSGNLYFQLPICSATKLVILGVLLSIEPLKKDLDCPKCKYILLKFHAFAYKSCNRRRLSI